MSTRMLQRRGSSAEWAAADPILGDGEIGFERDTGEIKIGNGVKRWSQLSYPYPASAMIDAKGDLIVGSADDTPARLPRGTTGQHLAVNADGSLGWQTPYAATDKVSKAGDTMTGLLTLSVGATLPNTQSLSFGMPSGNAGYIRGSLGSQLKILGGPSGLVVQNNADTNWLFSVNNTGQIEANGSTAGLVLHDQLDTNKSFTEYVYSNTWGLWSSIGGARVLTVDSAGNLAAAGATLSGYLNLSSSADGLVHYSGGVAGNTTWIYADIASVQKFRLERSGNVRATTLELHGGGNVFGPATFSVDANGTVWVVDNAVFNNTKGLFYNLVSGNQAYITGNGTNLLLRGGSTGIAVRNNADTATTLTVDNAGNITANGAQLGSGVATGFYYDGAGAAAVRGANGVYIQSTGAALTYGLFGLNNANLSMTAQATTMVPLIITGLNASQTADLFRAYDVPSGTAVVKIDNTGNIIGLANKALAIGFINDPSLTGAYLQLNPPSGLAGAVGIYTRSANNKGLVIRETAGQISDPFSIETSVGGQLTAIDSGGGAFHTAAFIGARVSYGTLTVTPTATNLIGQVIRGLASQSAAMQEWQDNGGGVRARIDNGGGLYAQAGIFAGTSPPVYLGARLSSVASAPAELALVLKAAASQTADIQQWQNSAGTVLARVDNIGNLTAASIGVTGQTVTTASPSSGAAGSLPSFPTGYLNININGVTRKIPFYA